MHQTQPERGDGEVRFEAPTSSAEWKARRRRIRATLRRLLGPLPARPAHPEVRVTSCEGREGYVLERFEMDNGVDAVAPGVLLLPHGLKRPAPAVQFLHQHGGHYGQGGCAELLREGWPVAGTVAEHLTRLGYVVLAIDAYCFGARAGRGPGLPSERGAAEEASTFKAHLWRGRSLWGMMLRDERMALDYLCSRPEVDRRRIGTFGMSMGSTRAWWLAALDDRIAATVAVACLTRYQDLVRERALAAHGIYYFVPGVLRHFDAEAIVACIAPRPLLALTGNEDPGSPVSGVRTISDAVTRVYDVMGAGDRFRSVVYEGIGHEYTPTMWQETLAWLNRWLGPAAASASP